MSYAEAVGLTFGSPALDIVGALVFWALLILVNIWTPRWLK